MIDMTNKMHFPAINGVFNIVENEDNAKWIKCSERKKKAIEKVFTEKMKLNKIDKFVYNNTEDAKVFCLVGKFKKLQNDPANKEFAYTRYVTYVD